MTLNQALLDILVCPVCKGTLSQEKEGDLLVCVTCRLKYPVREGIPVMLVDEAEKF